MPVDVVAHPTLVAIPYREHDVDELWTEDRETRVVDALYAAGIAFEISSRYWPPSKRIVRQKSRRHRRSAHLARI